MAPKSANTLHILNGDATRPEFDKAQIAGDVVVWRGIMAEGPVQGDIQSTEFWEARRQFVENVYGEPGSYDRFMSQLALIDQAKKGQNYNEIILWFEYDLFCHVNMLACLAYLEHTPVSVICLGDQLHGHWMGLGQVSAEDFRRLYDDRVPLAPEDRQYALDVWRLYQSKDHQSLRGYLRPHNTFRFLDRALYAHFERFPGINGINTVEYNILEIVKEGITDENQLIGKLLRDHIWLGFGDLQYRRILRSISALVDQDLTVTELGEQVLDHRNRFEQPHEFIGGVYRPDYFHETYGNS